MGDKIATPSQIENACSSVLQEMEKELDKLREEVQQAKDKYNELISSKDVVLKNLDTKLTEKEAVLKWCMEMKPEVLSSGSEGRVATSNDDEEYSFPFEIEDVKKPANLHEKVMKEYIDTRNLKYEYMLRFVDEMNKKNTFDELLQIIRNSKNRKGRIFLINRIKHLESEIAKNNSLAEGLAMRTNESIGCCWEKAANIYGPKMRQLMEEKGNLENEFLDKEEKLKDLQVNEALLDKEIATRLSKLERQTEINR